MSRSSVALGLGLLVAACASGGSGQPRPQRNLITAEEIGRITAATAHEIVQQLRPEYLRPRGRPSMTIAAAGRAVVYLNGVRMGGPEQLHAIRASDILQIRWVGAADATTRWGTGHGGGVIEIFGRY